MVLGKERQSLLQTVLLGAAYKKIQPPARWLHPWKTKSFSDDALATKKDARRQSEGGTLATSIYIVQHSILQKPYNFLSLFFHLFVHSGNIQSGQSVYFVK